MRRHFIEGILSKDMSRRRRWSVCHSDDDFRGVHVSCAGFTFTLLMIPVAPTSIRYSKHVVCLSRTMWSMRAALEFSTGLHLGHDRKHVIQPFVLDNK